mmetsp:Transcript_1203/g.3853  ORF Transcript_1203/g.3853 Transcript_1203/m.3853 type:complete len:219 (-) Transcript_1203:15-671(-)
MHSPPPIPRPQLPTSSPLPPPQTPAASAASARRDGVGRRCRRCSRRAVARALRRLGAAARRRALAERVLEVDLALGGLIHHGGRAGRPAGRAHLAVLLVELEGLQQAQRLVDAAADGQVVDRHLPQDARRVDDEQAAQRDAGVLAVLEEHSVVARDLLGDVGDEGDVHVAQAALRARLLAPREVAVLRVNGARHHLGAERAELGHAVRESDDLRRAHV